MVMTLPILKPFARLWSLEDGVAMVVTDLHGDWDAYQRYRDRFVDLRARGQADYLILTGDLIHGEAPGTQDKSIEIVLDVIDLQIQYDQAVIYLIGNHEMPHIYGISLARGKRVYTPDFEAALTRCGRRAEVISLFDSLPFFVRTRAGICLAHAGASAPIAAPKMFDKISNWSHRDLLDWADAALGSQNLEFLRESYASRHNIPYDVLVRYYLAVSGPSDPRYNDLLRGFVARTHATFDQILWPVLFTRCEETYGLTDYAIFLDAMLKELSLDYFPQQFLIAGHMRIPGGFQIIAKRHLRLASGPHATPRKAGRYLLFDTGRPGQDMDDLLAGLASVYKPLPYSSK